MEAGPLFEYLKVVIAPLNAYLVTELHRQPLSPARLARYALAERRRELHGRRRPLSLINNSNLLSEPECGDDDTDDMAMTMATILASRIFV